MKKPYKQQTSYDLYIFYKGADKSLARPTSRCIVSYGENVSRKEALLCLLPNC